MALATEGIHSSGPADWTVFVPDAAIVAADPTFISHLRQLSELAGVIKMWTTLETATPGVTVQGWGTDKELPTWLEALARDHKATALMHRERHPERYS